MSNPVVQQFTYFSLTINNPDENDLLITRNPNEKYVRQCVWTMEEGTEGTKHVQMWIRLFRNNSMSLVKKLYPRAHIKGCSRDEYAENTQQYAQKNDDTTRSSHVITTNGLPVDTHQAVQMVLDAVHSRFIKMGMGHYPLRRIRASKELSKDFHDLVHEMEDDKVYSHPHLSKLFVSAGYKSIFARFAEVMYEKLVSDFNETNRQTHTASIPTGSSLPYEHTPDAAYTQEDDTSSCTHSSEEDD